MLTPSATAIRHFWEAAMTILFLLSLSALVITVVISCLSMQNWQGGARMINADWMDPSEKFRLIARWGARN